MAGTISIDKLVPHAKNGYYFTDVEGEKYEEIKRSIDAYGIREPIVVTTDYTVISGHQRLRIAKDVGLPSVPIEIIDHHEADDVKHGRVSAEMYVEYLLIAYNIERRGEAEPDPIKKARIAKFWKEWWQVDHGGSRRQIGGLKTLDDVAEAIGETRRSTERLLKLNELIPEIQTLVSSGKQGTTAAEQLAYLTEEEQREVYTLFGEELTKQTVEEVKRLRREVESSRDTERVLRDTIESLRSQPEPDPVIIEKPVYQVREIVPADVQARLTSAEEQIAKIEKERDELEVSLVRSYDRIRELEKLERSVKSTEHNPLFDIYRSASNTVSYLQTFTENERFACDIIAGAERKLIDSLRHEMAKIEKLSRDMWHLIDTETRVVVVDGGLSNTNQIVEVIA